MKKKTLTIISSIVALALILFFVVPVVLDFANVPKDKNGTEVLITIEENTSTAGIATLLKDNGLIRSKSAFMIKVKTSKYNGKLGSGTYTLSPAMSSEEICARLSEPKILKETVKITFPEGYSAEQMACLLEEEGIVSADSFLGALSDEYDYEFLKEIPKADYNYVLQGFLFPDTYEFYMDTTSHDIVDKMLQRFDEVYKSKKGNYKDVFKIITKASMIEKEAKLHSERATIAGVIENRSIKGMRYQIDATVLYDATDGLYNTDSASFIAQNIRELDSPYNTYRIDGLPVGPICNPGADSIDASINPEKHEYLYYHTDTNKNDGSHIFTKSLEEHEASMK